MDPAVEEAIALLQNSLSRKRVSGAKRLRKLADPKAGPALFEALQNEVKDARTWAAQYQMILAVGFCGHVEAISFLDELCHRDFEATILYLALGDALLRLLALGRSADEALEPIYTYGNPMITLGGFRALAMLRLTPSDEGIRRMFEVASDPSATEAVAGSPGDDSGLRLWPAVASARWPMEIKEEFLDSCEGLRNSQLATAVAESRVGKLTNWRPY